MLIAEDKRKLELRLDKCRTYGWGIQQHSKAVRDLNITASITTVETPWASVFIPMRSGIMHDQALRTLDVLIREQECAGIRHCAQSIKAVLNVLTDISTDATNTELYTAIQSATALLHEEAAMNEGEQTTGANQVVGHVGLVRFSSILFTSSGKLTV